MGGGRCRQAGRLELAHHGQPIESDGHADARDDRVENGQPLQISQPVRLAEYQLGTDGIAIYLTDVNRYGGRVDNLDAMTAFPR